MQLTQENSPQQPNSTTTQTPSTTNENSIKGERATLASRLNWLRAGVLGANDGIISTAGLVVGVSGAAVDSRALLATGIAGLIAGSLSMAAGEYVSVSTQRDTERAQIERERQALSHNPDDELSKLANTFKEQGVDTPLSREIAAQLSKRNALDAHAHFRFGIDPDALTNPWHAALASMFSFALGAIIPLCAIILSPSTYALWITATAVCISLAITGSVSAYLGGAPVIRATARNLIGGNLAMAVTYWIGVVFGHFF
ncbi:MAG: VIT family protein [Actinomycetaceae bacterium]|nr:VIT family protein [Actinomycetaceae bacterium]